jgi:hypothetical protein
VHSLTTKTFRHGGLPHGWPAPELWSRRSGSAGVPIESGQRDGDCVLDQVSVKPARATAAGFVPDAGAARVVPVGAAAAVRRVQIIALLSPCRRTISALAR